MAVKRRRRGDRTARVEVEGHALRIDTFGPDGSNGVSVWINRAMTVSKLTRGKGGTLIRLVPDGATVAEAPSWRPEVVEPIVTPSEVTPDD